VSPEVHGRESFAADVIDGAMDMKIGDRETKVLYKGKWIGAECDKK